jgi:hypothetical protein
MHKNVFVITVARLTILIFLTFLFKKYSVYLFRGALFKLILVLAEVPGVARDQM